MAIDWPDVDELKQRLDVTSADLDVPRHDDEIVGALDVELMRRLLG